MKPKIGKFVSLWERTSRRHKWRITHTFVLVTFISVKRGDTFISWQESGSGGETSTGWTSARLYDCRKIGRPQFDVRPQMQRASWHDWPDGNGWWFDAELKNWLFLKEPLNREFFAEQPPKRWFGPWTPPGR